MKVFTYKQYIQCIHTFRLNAVMQLAEESIEYNLNQLEKRYSNDKIIKRILEDKKEATEFINQFIEPREKVKEENLVLYTSNYMSKKYKTKEANLIYKLKNQDIFFLIEHQSSIDYNIHYRMLNYCLDIMQEWGRNKRIGRNISYPIVVPIVIYTGSQKWKKLKNFQERQVSNYTFERYKIDLEYNFIDVNKLPKQVLLEKDTIFGYAMFLEKANNYEELIGNLDIIIKESNNKENLKVIASIVSDLFNPILDKDKQERLLEKIEKVS